MTRATLLIAASSAGADLAGTGESPTFNNASAVRRVGLEMGQALGVQSRSAIALHRFPAGGRWLAGMPIQSGFADSLPPRSRICSPKTRAASTNVGSFSRSSACSGVFDFMRLTAHSSRDGASKFIMRRMQERALPESVNAAPVQVIVAACRPASLRKIQGGQIAVRLIWPNARTSELIHQEAGDLQHQIVNGFGIDTEAALTRQQPVVRIALVELRSRER